MNNAQQKQQNVKELAGNRLSDALQNLMFAASFTREQIQLNPQGAIEQQNAILAAQAHAQAGILAVLIAQYELDTKPMQVVPGPKPSPLLRKD